MTCVSCGEEIFPHLEYCPGPVALWAENPKWWLAKIGDPDIKWVKLSCGPYHEDCSHQVTAGLAAEYFDSVPEECRPPYWFGPEHPASHAHRMASRKRRMEAYDKERDLRKDGKTYAWSSAKRQWAVQNLEGA